mgnify:CR=1 FL=1
MRKKVLKIIAIVVAAIFIFSTGFCLGINSSLIKKYITYGSFVNSSESSGLLGKIYTDDSSEFDTRIIEETLKFTYGNALTEKSKHELVEAAIEGILASLDDKHTEYFTKEEYEQIMESYSGTMSGIGVVVMMDEDDQTIVVMPIQDTPAFRAGLKEGDIIVKVNGTEIKDTPLESVVSMIKGKEGTEVILTMFRPKENKEFEVKIIRERFYIPNLFSKILEEDIAYIQYIGFQEKGAQKLDEEIQKLIDSGAKGIIFDLRNNLGGVLDDAVNVSDLFLDEGLIVSVKGRSGSEEISSNYYAKKGKYTKIPLVVLINGYSASASEVVAGALKDSERAILIGEKSFGKGTVQVLKELTDGSGIKFTTAKYYLPSGSSVEGKGLHPDIMVKWDPDSEKDVQLEKAIEEINLLIGKNTSK